MSEISKLLHKYFSKEEIRVFAIYGMEDDRPYQVSKGFKKEMYREFAGAVRFVGYELTEKGKAQLDKNSEELEKLWVIIERQEGKLEEQSCKIDNFYKEEREYWRKHPNYTEEEEYKRMTEDEKYAYIYLGMKRSRNGG